MQLSLAVAQLSVLVTGPTGLLGPHIARELARAGHRVTLLHHCDPRTRGCSGQPLLGELEELPRVDAVVDNAVFMGRSVERLLAKLPGFKGRYVLMSSMSACDDFPTPGQVSSECHLLPAMPPDAVAQGSLRRGGYYGAGKADAERVLVKNGVDAVMLRLNWLVGPGNDKARLLPWWLGHVASGEPYLAPPDEDQTRGGLQLVDVRAVAAWSAALVEPDAAEGAFLVCGPAVTFAQFLKAIEAVVGEAGLEPGQHCNARGPRTRDLTWPYMQAFQPEGVIDDSAAQKAGLVFPTVKQTLADTLAWQREHGTLPSASAELRGAMPRSSELELYEACQRRHVASALEFGEVTPSGRVRRHEPVETLAPEQVVREAAGRA